MAGWPIGQCRPEAAITLEQAAYVLGEAEILLEEAADVLEEAGFVGGGRECPPVVAAAAV